MEDVRDGVWQQRDAASMWSSLRAELSAAGYSHVSLDGGTDGWIDHLAREVYTDRERDLHDEVRQLSELVVGLRWTLGEPLSPERDVARDVAELSTGSVIAALSELGLDGGLDGASRLARACVGELRRRVPAAFDDLDDVDPGSGEYLPQLVEAAREWAARGDGGRFRPGPAQMASVVGRWRRLKDGQWRACQERVWTRRCGADGDGRPRVEHVLGRCLMEARWTFDSSAVLIDAATDTLRCDRHGARALRRESTAQER